MEENGEKRGSSEGRQPEPAVRGPGIGHLHKAGGPAQLTRSFRDGSSMSPVSVTVSDGELVTKSDFRVLL